MGFVRVASRFGEAKDEKCPNCKMIVQNFLVKNEEAWVCFQCGTHFTPKSVLLPERGRQKERLKDQAQDSTAAVAKVGEPENLACPKCGKECKSKLGLHSHMRTHKE